MMAKPTRNAGVNYLDPTLFGNDKVIKTHRDAVMQSLAQALRNHKVSTLAQLLRRMPNGYVLLTVRFDDWKYHTDDKGVDILVREGRIVLPVSNAGMTMAMGHPVDACVLVYMGPIHENLMARTLMIEAAAEPYMTVAPKDGHERIGWRTGPGAYAVPADIADVHQWVQGMHSILKEAGQMY